MQDKQEETLRMNSLCDAVKLVLSHTSERRTKTPSSGGIWNDMTKTISKDNKLPKKEQEETLNSLRDAIKLAVYDTPERGTKAPSSGWIKPEVTKRLSKDSKTAERSISKEAKRAVVKSSRTAHSTQRLETSVIFPMDGESILKKLVTRREPGPDSIQVQARFTPVSQRMRYSPITVFAKMSWPFLTLVRKALADKQRNTTKGEDSVFNWIFNYNVNKDIRKIKSELKMVFGPRFIEFRGSHLRKKIADFLDDQTGNASFLINVWVVPKHTKR